MPTFLHAADVHLDSPLRGIETYAGAPVDARREATRRAFENLVDLAVEREVAFLVLAGDLYDGDWKDYRTGLFFNAQMSRLRAASIPVYAVAGNHDAESQITKHLRVPDNVHFFATKKAETMVLEDVGVALHGRGYATRAVRTDLSATYPERVPGMLNVGILHTSVDGREGHENYAPCSVAGLQSRGYGYWALGHVHAREELSRDPWIVFPGNLQGRHAKETGPKGASLVEYSGDEVERVEEVALDVVRWARLTLDASEATSPDDVLETARESLIEALEEAERPLAVRIEIVGSTLAHANLVQNPERWRHELQSLATDCGDAWIEKVKIRTRSRTDRDALRGRDDAIGTLVRALDDLDADPDAAASFSKELDDLRKKLPLQALEETTVPPSGDTEALHEALLEAKELLLARLIEGGTA